MVVIIPFVMGILNYYRIRNSARLDGYITSLLGQRRLRTRRLRTKGPTVQYCICENISIPFYGVHDVYISLSLPSPRFIDLYPRHGKSQIYTYRTNRVGAKPAAESGQRNGSGKRHAKCWAHLREW